jgi:chromosome segregation ATPase
MSTYSLVIGIGIFILAALFAIIIFFPDRPLGKKKRQPKADASDTKDWEAVILRLEKHIYSLRTEIETLKAQERKNLKELALEKERNVKLQEKLSKEKEWLSQEEESIDKRDKEIRELKQNFIKIENDFEIEHGQRLKIEGQLKETKEERETLTKDNREMSLKIARLETEIDAYKKELARQKKTIEELSKKSDETQWVAKTEHDKLLQKLKEKEKEIERLSSG